MTEPRLVIGSVELLEVAIPLVRPFRTSFGEEKEKRAVLVRVRSDGLEGWGECVASPEPRYSEEWLDGAWWMLERHLVPALLERGTLPAPDELDAVMGWVRGNRMTRAALEMAVLDAWLRAAGRSLSDFLGCVRDRVPCGVSVGIAPSVDAMVEEIAGYVEAGYQRIKLKIEPGRDVEVVRSVRSSFPDVPLSVDANASYSLDDAEVFAELDRLGLTMIEQPLHHEDLVDHAKLQARLDTPICLDESIRSARDAMAAIDLGACRVINIKPGRVGGLLEAKRVHDAALEGGVPTWVGGMLETGVGRAANLALASLPGVTMPGDTSASRRYFASDLTDPFELAPDGTMAVPAGPGIGVAPLPDRLEATVVRRTELT